MTPERAAKIERMEKNSQRDLTVVFENIHDPHNISAILRTCDAVGVRSVHLLYNVEKAPKLGKKSSSSATKWIEVKKWKKPEECFSALKKEGFLIVGTHLGSESKGLYQSDLTQKIALVVGNEHRGVSAEALQFCDENLFIPMQGMIQSLNVSVATAVILYEALRQREYQKLEARS